MPITGDEKRNKQISQGVIVTVILQLIGLVIFFTQLNSRVGNIEKILDSESYYTAGEGQLLEQKVNFYTATVIKMENKLDYIIERLPRE